MDAIRRHPVAWLLIGFLLLMMLFSSVSIVPETRQGIITRFGKPVRIINRYKDGSEIGQIGAGITRMPAAFFSVSLAAVDDVAEARQYVEQLEQETGWKPEAVTLVAGALPYTGYGFIKRRMMRRIVAGKSPVLSTDTSRDHVYTDWQQVDELADTLASAVQRRGILRGRTNVSPALAS